MREPSPAREARTREAGSGDVFLTAPGGITSFETTTAPQSPEEGWRVKVYLVRTLTDKRSGSSLYLSTRRSMYVTLGQAHTLPEALEAARRWRASRFPPLRVWVEEKGKIAHAERRKKPR